MKKYKYSIVGLDCPNCARELEEGLNKQDSLNNVVVNFTNKKISYETDSLTINDVNKLVKKFEPEASVVEEETEGKREYHLWVLLLGLFIGLIGIYVDISKVINMILVVSSFVILLYKPFLTAVKMLVRNKSINENALIVISVLGAYFVGEKLEGIMVVSLYLLGKILEEKAINNSRNSIKTLVDLKQDYGNVVDGNSSVKMDVDDINIGDVLLVKKGEKIPLDGVVVKGSTKLDLKSLTGESDFVEVNVNDSVMSGSINTSDLIYVEVTSLYKDSTVSKILELISDASDKKAKTETLVNKVSKYYTPVVLVLALIVAFILPFVFDVNYSESIYRALTFLVISCPCAIAISVPLSYFTGIGVSSKNGILIKGSNFLDNISQIKSIVFDKTGTLTNGSFEVKDISIFDESYSKDSVIEILAKGEMFSNHPISKSILNIAPSNISNDDVSDYKEISGQGITYKVGGKFVKAGTKSLCGCEMDATLHLNVDGKHIASLDISDGIKDNAKECILYLKSLNVKTYMFTGDKKSIADSIGNRLGIDEVYAQLLPNDKYSLYESLTSDNDLVAFVGDGINDTPVLKRADIGISMGGVGATSAIEASDIVIMRDDLDKIVKCIKISKYTRKIIVENLIFALFVKVLILLLSVFGIATMWFAVFADTGVTLLTILNTLRILYSFKKSQ